MTSYLSLSSEDLVTACVGSDHEAAWTEFVRRFRPVIAKVVLRTVRRLTYPHPHLIDDVVQEVFLKLCADDCLVLRRFQSRHQDAIYGYLKSVAASVVHDHFKFERARKRDTARTEALSEHAWADSPSARQGSANAIEDKVALRQIDEVLRKLFPGENLARNRAIFWLYNRVGMTASAIASIPSIGLNTKGVESQLRRMTNVIQSHVDSGP